MKILFLSHLDMNLYLFRRPIMEALHKEGHEVIAMCPKGEYFDRFKELGIKAISYEISRESLNPFKELKTLLSIAQKLSELKPDILHTFMLKPNIYGTLASKIASIPYVICSVTGLGSFYIEESFKSRAIRYLIETLSRIVFKIAKKVVFQNEDDRQLFIQKGLVESSKTHLIKGSGINTKLFDPALISPSTLVRYRQELGLEKKHVVLMVARAIAHKGVREYYEAARLLGAFTSDSHLAFIFVGDTDEGNPSCVSSKELYSPHVLWLGHREDILELMALCDVFVLPSYREGIPRTLLEASSLAKPMVTSLAVGCKEVVKEGENGFLVPVGDTKALAQKIHYLVQNPALRLSMGEKARQIAQKEFDVSIIVKAHLELYKEVRGDLQKTL